MFVKITSSTQGLLLEHGGVCSGFTGRLLTFDWVVEVVNLDMLSDIKLKILKDLVEIYGVGVFTEDREIKTDKFILKITKLDD